jgi:hypothetical protein
MKTFQGVVTSNFEITKQRNEMKKLYRKVCTDIPITQHFNYRNFIQELKPVFCILLGKNIQYNALTDFKTQQVTINENTVDHINSHEDDETLPINYEKDSLSNFMKFVKQTKKMQDDEAKFINSIINSEDVEEEATDDN